MSDTELKPDADAVCDACGASGAYRFETETLCTDCYAGRGSCCSAEFSGRPPECEKVDEIPHNKPSPP